MNNLYKNIKSIKINCNKIESININFPFIIHKLNKLIYEKEYNDIKILAFKNDNSYIITKVIKENDLYVFNSLKEEDLYLVLECIKNINYI